MLWRRHSGSSVGLHALDKTSLLQPETEPQILGRLRGNLATLPTELSGLLAGNVANLPNEFCRLLGGNLVNLTTEMSRLLLGNLVSLPTEVSRLLSHDHIITKCH
jgi:hypothetical protein